jgi:hypothetical protein
VGRDRVYLQWSFILYYFGRSASDVDQLVTADAQEYLNLIAYLSQRGSMNGNP